MLDRNHSRSSLSCRVGSQVWACAVATPHAHCYVSTGIYCSAMPASRITLQSTGRSTSVGLPPYTSTSLCMSGAGTQHTHAPITDERLRNLSNLFKSCKALAPTHSPCIAPCNPDVSWACLNVQISQEMTSIRGSGEQVALRRRMLLG